jgi:hypothetical protein
MAAIQGGNFKLRRVDKAPRKEAKPGGSGAAAWVWLGMHMGSRQHDRAGLLSHLKRWHSQHSQHAQRR